MSGNKAMKRALETKDAIRVGASLPLITDETVLMTPDLAKEMLKRNKNNRPINWKKVEEYAKLMREGRWRLTSQGIILDEKGNILTGQKRLWAVVYADTSVYMRVSRGTPSETANLLDRGTPQSARDLATRKTERKHSPTEASIARALCVLKGNLRPSTDELSEVIASNENRAISLINETKGTKKTKAVLMIMAAICYTEVQPDAMFKYAKLVQFMADQLQSLLLPQGADQCWNRGAAFSLAMEQAKKCVVGTVQ